LLATLIVQCADAAGANIDPAQFIAVFRHFPDSGALVGLGLSLRRLSSAANMMTDLGVILTTFWGVVGFLVIALQLAFPVLNLGLEWTTFGRLRPLHTSR
jgi:hypothetical protein